MLGHWAGLTLFLEDGRIEVDTNTVERTIRPIAEVDSLCVLLPSIWEHWDLLCLFGATRARSPLECGGHPCVVQIGRPDLVWRAGHDLLGRDDPVTDQASDGVMSDAQHLGGFAQCEPLAILLGRTIGADAVDACAGSRHGGPSRFCPDRSASPCGSATPRCARRDQRPAMLRMTARASSEVRAAVLAGSRLADPQLGVLAALPVDRRARPRAQPRRRRR